MNKGYQGENRGPYIGDLLRLVAHRMDNPNFINVSVDDVMSAFNIDSYEADELIDELELGFAEKIGANQYRLTEIGIKEIAKIKQSISKKQDCKGS